MVLCTQRCQLMTHVAYQLSPKARGPFANITWREVRKVESSHSPVFVHIVRVPDNRFISQYKESIILKDELTIFQKINQMPIERSILGTSIFKINCRLFLVSSQEIWKQCFVTTLNNLHCDNANSCFLNSFIFRILSFKKIKCFMRKFYINLFAKTHYIHL